MNKTIIYTDGASRGNPGPGGWGAIVVQNGTVTELGGRDNMTTNNKMELQGAIEALKTVDSGTPITLFSDSQYVIKGMTEWIDGWQRNGWRNSQKKPVLNRELWEQLVELSKDKDISWKYTAGHAQDAGNNRCDEIATTFADNEPTKLYNGSLTGYPVKI